jgi:hypothetical protein
MSILTSTLFQSAEFAELAQSLMQWSYRMADQIQFLGTSSPQPHSRSREMSAQTKQPVDTAKLGGLSVATFPNQNQEGKTTGYFVVFQKSSFNREENKYVNQSILLNADEVSAAIRVLQQSERKLLQLT